MACRGQRLWLVLVSLVLSGAGCLGDAAIDEVSPRPLLIEMSAPRELHDLGYEVVDIVFEVRLSEADVEELGAPGTRIDNRPNGGSVFIDTEFGYDGANHLYRGEDHSNEVSAPCFVRDVLVVNLSTAEEFVAIEAGHCIENQWRYDVLGAYDYLIDAGPCTGIVMLEDGRELTVKCR